MISLSIISSSSVLKPSISFQSTSDRYISNPAALVSKEKVTVLITSSLSGGLLRKKKRKKGYQFTLSVIMFWLFLITVFLHFHVVCVFAASSLRPPNIVPKPLNTMLRSSLKIQKFRTEQFEKLDAAHDNDSNAIKGSKIFMEPTFTLQGHLDAVECIDWSMDGTLLSSGSRDKIVRLWDTLNGHLSLQLQGHQDFVTCLSISPKGNRIASGSRDETVRLWDLQTGKCKRIFDDHCSPVAFVKYNEQGTKLAFGYRDTPIRIVNTDITEQKETTMIEGLTGRVVRVSWSPDGTVLATGSRDGCIRLYCSETGLFLKEMVGHQGSILCMSWSPDNTHIATGGDDKTIRIWDILTGQQIIEMNRHSSAVLSLDFSPNGLSLVSSSFDTNLRLWDVQSGSPLGILEGQVSSPLTFVQFSNNYCIDTVSF